MPRPKGDEDGFAFARVLIDGSRDVVVVGLVDVETDGDVDFNILVNDEDPWYVDYDSDGAITANDRLLFSLDHAAGEPWTDLVGNMIIDNADMMRFDDETGLAVARQSYLIEQGVAQ